MRRPSLIILLFVHTLSVYDTSALAIAMTWSNTWKDILSGGSPRWIVRDVNAKQQALANIAHYTSLSIPSSSNNQANGIATLKIFCPLAGDDTFVHNAWSQGHSVTALDLVPAAVAAMRQQFGPDETDWTKEEDASNNKNNDMVVWKHSSGRATLYQGDVLTRLPSLSGSFDAIYDKDSFGAIPESIRSSYCDRLAEYLTENGIVYIEVKNKSEDNPGRYQGPPFHLEKEDLMEDDNFGKAFAHVASLGEVYDIGMGGNKQTGHILKRIISKP
jgi:hypothetical protein